MSVMCRQLPTTGIVGTVDIEILETNIDNYISFVDNTSTTTRRVWRDNDMATAQIPIPIKQNELYYLHELREKEQKLAEKRNYYDMLMSIYFLKN